jgi:putative tricarboxylic transport membrane protein
MTLRIKSPQDVGAAIILTAIGLAGLWFGRDYDIGSVSQMGPGYMPMLLSIGLLVFGAVIGLRSVTIDGPPIATGRWYPSVMVLVALLMFAGLIERAGLGPTTFIVALICAFATSDVKWKQAVALAVTLALFCVVVFVYGLRQPIPAFGSG